MKRPDVVFDWSEQFDKDDTVETAPKPKPKLKKQKAKSKEGEPPAKKPVPGNEKPRPKIDQRPPEGPVALPKPVRRTEGAADTTAERRPQPRQESYEDVRERLPAEVRDQVDRLLDRLGGRWHLERRQFLFSWLVRRERHELSTATVEIDHKLTLRRKEQPPAAPDTISQRVLDAVREAPPRDVPARLSEIASALTERDEVRIRIESPGETTEITIAAQTTAREAVPHHEPSRLHPSEALEEPVELPLDQPIVVRADHPPVPEERFAKEIAGVEGEKPPEQSTLLTEEEQTLARALRVADQLPERAWDKVMADGTEPVVTEADIDELIAEIYAAEGILTSPTDQELSEGVVPPEAVESQTSTRSASEGSEPIEVSQVLHEVLDLLAAHSDTLEKLPPMAGGAPGGGAKERPRSPEVVVANRPTVARPDRRDVFMPVSMAGENIAVWERGWTESRDVPSEQLKRSARKLIRLLARRYGIRMTPKLEAYLLQIALRPSETAGGLIFSLAANRESLVRTLQVIWLNYGRGAAW